MPRAALMRPSKTPMTSGPLQEHCLFPTSGLASSFTQNHGVVVSWCTRSMRTSEYEGFGAVSETCPRVLCRKALKEMFRDAFLAALLWQAFN